MRVVAALGGNALLQRGKPPDSDVQQARIADAVRALAPLVSDHDLVETGGAMAPIGRLDDAEALLHRKAGTIVAA